MFEAYVQRVVSKVQINISWWTEGQTNCMVFFFIFDTSLFAFCGCNFLMKWLHRYPYDQLQNGWLMFQLDNHHHWHAILSFDVLLTHQNHINLAVSHGPPNPEFQTSLSRQLNHFKLKAGVCVVSSSLFNVVCLLFLLYGQLLQRPFGCG